MPEERRAWWSWGSVVLLAVLCAVLILLQYRWTGDVARAEHDRLKSGLDATLARVAQDFNAEIASAAAELIPPADRIEADGAQSAYAARFVRWRDAGRDPLFRRVALAFPREPEIALAVLDPATARFELAPWPAEWDTLREQLGRRMRRQGGGPFEPDDSPVIEFPRMGRPPAMEQEWLVLEVDVAYVRSTLLPRLVQQSLPDYDVDVVSRIDPRRVIFSTLGESGGRIGIGADGSAALFSIDPGRRGGRGPGGRPMGLGRPPMFRWPDLDRGKWTLLARHRAGSFEAVVERARWRNLGVSGAILLLMIATIAALVRYSRKSHELAALQMNFVAGVSHELRTPLTVIRTAAFNLRSKVAVSPEQVERYGALIQDESEKLTALVEQVLRFAGTGEEPSRKERVSIAGSIEANVDAASVETRISPGLPDVVGDPVALGHVIRNLLDNALKHGQGVVRVTAAQTGADVEVRVSDEGPGIPPDERGRVFDPFFRGRAALAGQVHGTGLGLNLVKRIVEAHRGTVTLNTASGGGAEFVVRLPAAPPGVSK